MKWDLNQSTIIIISMTETIIYALMLVLITCSWVFNPNINNTIYTTYICLFDYVYSHYKIL